jgi:hypothetical protein
MLVDAGFQKIVIDPSDTDSLASHLTPYELRSYPASGGQVIWYYDPDQCTCVFEGSQDACDRYQMLVRQQSDLAQYAAQSEDQEIVSLNAMNGTMFPPPIFWIGGSSERGRRGGPGWRARWWPWRRRARWPWWRWTWRRPWALTAGYLTARWKEATLRLPSSVLREMASR